jgi:LDH2 family malate/lactate/ureidoglycolate dehydrogenase
VGRAGGGGGPDLAAFHERDFALHRRALRRRGRALRHQPDDRGIPIPDEPPFILDMATSAVAQGKIRVAHNKREKVSPDWLIDNEASPRRIRSSASSSPSARCAPSACTRATAWRWCASCSAARLTGGGTWHSDDRSKKRVWNGMLTILIDPKRLGTGDAFATETTAFLESLRKSPVAPGFDKVRIAGEPERETRAKRERDGIAVDQNHLGRDPRCRREGEARRGRRSRNSPRRLEIMRNLLLA